MPSHTVHRENTRKRLGKDYSKIHKLIDNPYLVPFLRSKHRAIFHDPITPFLLANILARNDPAGKGLEVILAAISHYIDDYRLESYTTATTATSTAAITAAITTAITAAITSNSNNSTSSRRRSSSSHNSSSDGSHSNGGSRSINSISTKLKNERRQKKERMNERMNEMKE
ncbi:MAG: hypothetical protein QW475_04540 [Candidatus Nitrosocaldus sp.]